MTMTYDHLRSLVGKPGLELSHALPVNVQRRLERRTCEQNSGSETELDLNYIFDHQIV